MNNKQARVLVVKIVLACFCLALPSGCSSGNIEDVADYFDEAAIAGEVDARAELLCDHSVSRLSLVAAIESSPQEIRRLAEDVTTKDGWDVAMPEDESVPMSICIYDVSNVSGLGSDFDYMAMWAGEDETSGGNGIITLWQSPLAKAD